MVTNQLKNIASDRKRIGEGRKRSTQEALFVLAWRLNRKFIISISQSTITWVVKLSCGNVLLLIFAAFLSTFSASIILPVPAILYIIAYHPNTDSGRINHTRLTRTNIFNFHNIFDYLHFPKYSNIKSY